MVTSPKDVQTTQQEVISPTRSQQQAVALATLSKKVEAEPKRGKTLSPSELVAQGLAAAAAAAAQAAAPFASFGNAVPFRAVTSRMQNAAAAGQSTAVATIATVTAAVSSNFNKEHSKAPRESQTADPTQWFVCDDPVSHTRYFVIQGSETIDHWRVNLSFDPVVFEDKSLGVKVVLLTPCMQHTHHYPTVCLLSDFLHTVAYIQLYILSYLMNMLVSACSLSMMCCSPESPNCLTGDLSTKHVQHLAIMHLSLLTVDLCSSH